MSLLTEDICKAREAVIQAHVVAETHQHSVAGTIATFRHPRYEIPAFGLIAEGSGEVNEFLTVFLRTFPDLWLTTKSIYHSEAASFVEVEFGATQYEDWNGVKNAGRAFKVDSVLVFMFEGADLVCEKLYLDSATIVRQLSGEKS